MKLKRVLSAVCAIIGLFAAAAGVYFSLSARNSTPVLLTPPTAATNRVTGMMDAICQGDYERARTYILGNPGLGVDREASDRVGVLIWNAFIDSLTYQLEGACYATDDGLAQNVTMSCLDVTSVTANLRERSQTLLEQRVQAAEDTSEIYDENNEYREDFVMNVLYDAAEQALREDSASMTVSLTLNLKYQDGRWWVIADSELLDAVSGGILY